MRKGFVIAVLLVLVGCSKEPTVGEVAVDSYINAVKKVGSEIIEDAVKVITVIHELIRPRYRPKIMLTANPIRGNPGIKNNSGDISPSEDPLGRQEWFLRFVQAR